MGLSTGDVVGAGRFVIAAPLGAGAMGAAYRARDLVLGIELALKTVHHAGAEQIAELKREFRALAGVSHPNLVRLYELFAAGEECFFTMEIVEGDDLVAGLRAPLAAAEPLPAAVASAAFLQVVHGLRALHEIGRTHGDLKPSNVMLTRSGRVVLLDFGLSAQLRGRHAHAVRDSFRGSLAYAAPEQMWRSSASEAADWYALGALLHEAMSGLAPFRGTFEEVMRAKDTGAIPRPSVSAPGVDATLDTLACRLLARDPERRPAFAAIVERLESVAPQRPEPAPPALPKASGPFVGRVADLAELGGWLADVRVHGASIGHLRGASGVGKSELVQRFLGTLPPDAALVLRGRCHPQESVPYKAVDPLVDELGTLLSDGVVAPVPRLDPARCAALGRLFPILSAVPELRVAAPSDVERDPHEIRREGFHALRALLAALTERVPMVLWIDDAQWGDPDSAALLRELLRPPDAPRILLLLSHRDDGAARGAFLDQLRASGAQACRAREWTVAPLAHADCATLAALLLGRLAITASPDVKQRIAADAAGSPFFVGELARFIAPSDPARGAVVSSLSGVAQVTRARVDRLVPEARELLELAAVAEGPLRADVALAAAGLDGAGWALLLDLCAQCLLREGSARGARPETVETYHDRTRQALLEDLATRPERLRQRHLQLADALLARGDSDPQQLLQHLVGAGDEARAAEHALRAAEQASAALAFVRAAELYETALRLRGDRTDDWPLRVERARLLGAAGRSADAGALLERAARDAAAATSDAETVAALLARAAEYHLYAGLLVHGTRLLREGMRALDLPVPATARAAMRTSLALRLRFLLRGSRLGRYAAADAAPVERRRLLRLDALSGAARGTIMLDHRLADALAMQHLLGALALGEPSRALRALCMEAASEANLGGRWLRARSASLLDQADVLAAETGAPYDRAVVLLHRGAVALFSARFRDAVGACDDALDLFRAQCAGAAWEVVICHSFLVAALAQLGDLRALRRRLGTLLADARERGDRYSIAFFQSNDCVLDALARDDPAAALAGADAALVGVPDQNFTSMHFGHVVASVRVHLYRGDGARAWTVIDEAWPRLRASGFLALEGLGVVLHYLRGSAALAALESGRELGSDGAQSRSSAGDRRLRRAASSAVRRLRRVSLPSGAPLAHALVAGLHALDGAPERRAQALASAIAGFDAVEMALHRESARMLHGIAVGDAAQLARAQAWMAVHEVCDPVALARATVPLGVACTGARRRAVGPRAGAESRLHDLLQLAE